MNMTTYSEVSYPHIMVNVSKTPLDMIILLHDSAIDSLQQALLYIDKEDGDKKLRHISRTVAIIEDLLASLDFKEGGNVAFRLHNVYAFIMKELAIASTKNDPGKIRHIQHFLRELKSAWRQVK